LFVRLPGKWQNIKVKGRIEMTSKITKAFPIVFYALLCFVSAKNVTVFDKTGLTQVCAAQDDKDVSNGGVGGDGGGPPVL
jgi:hypothetical protein